MKPNVEKIQNLFLSGRLLKGTVNVISIDPSWKYGKAPNFTMHTLKSFVLSNIIYEYDFNSIAV